MSDYTVKSDLFNTSIDIPGTLTLFTNARSFVKLSNSTGLVSNSTYGMNTERWSLMGENTTELDNCTFNENSHKIVSLAKNDKVLVSNWTFHKNIAYEWGLMYHTELLLIGSGSLFSCQTSAVMSFFSQSKNSSNERTLTRIHFSVTFTQNNSSTNFSKVICSGNKTKLAEVEYRAKFILRNLKIEGNSSISCGFLYKNTDSALAISHSQIDDNYSSHDSSGAFCIRNNSASSAIDIAFDKDNITCSGREMKGKRQRSFLMSDCHLNSQANNNY